MAIGPHGSACHPAEAVPAHHLRSSLLNVNLQCGSDGINGADPVGALLQASPMAVATVSGPVAGQLADNGDIHMLLGVVQHGKQCVLCIDTSSIIWAPARSTSLQWPGPPLRYGPRNQ